MTKSGQKIGFIGLGIMGAPMALNLLKAGHILFVQTRSKTPLELVEGGATVCTSAEEVAKRADIVITMLPDTPNVEEVLFGERGVAAGLKPGAKTSEGLPKIVIDMSSISPMATQRFAQRIEALGVLHLLDVGTGAEARTGTGEHDHADVGIRRKFSHHARQCTPHVVIDGIELGRVGQRLPDHFAFFLRSLGERSDVIEDKFGCLGTVVLVADQALLLLTGADALLAQGL